MPNKIYGAMDNHRLKTSLKNIKTTCSKLFFP
jgi:hypothetical protein